MNENATDENTPTGKAMGNIAMIGLSAAVLIGGGAYGVHQLGKAVKGAENMAKGAKTAVAKASVNRKTAKDIKNEAKNISKNHGSELTSGEVKNLAGQNHVISNYTEQANPNMKAEDLSKLKASKSEQNIENHKNLREIDVTENMDDMFDSGYNYEDGNVVKSTPNGDGHNKATADVKTVQDGFDGLDMPSKTNDYNVNGNDIRNNLEDGTSLEDLRNARKTPQEQERIKQATEDAAADESAHKILKSKNDQVNNSNLYNGNNKIKYTDAEIERFKTNSKDGTVDTSGRKPHQAENGEQLSFDNQQLSMFDEGYDKTPVSQTNKNDAQTSMFDPNLPKEQEAELARMQKEKEAYYGTGSDYATQEHKTDSSKFFNN